MYPRRVQVISQPGYVNLLQKDLQLMSISEKIFPSFEFLDVKNHLLLRLESGAESGIAALKNRQSSENKGKQTFLNPR